MNKEQQELSETTMETKLPPMDDQAIAGCQSKFIGHRIQARLDCRERQLLAALMRERDQQALLSVKDALIASLKSEILKQNKAEDELLATGEKLAEERK